MIENVEKIWELIHEDLRQTIYGLADTVGISYGVWEESLTENFNMCHITTKFVPWLFDKWSKAAACECVFELWEKANEDPTFTSGIVTVDESWIYGYDPETK
jgi:hypothetical protein